MWPYNPINLGGPAFFGGTPIGTPFPPAGGGGGGFLGGVGDFVEDVGDIVGGVTDIIELIRGGSGSGGSGAPLPNPFEDLIGDVGGGNSSNLTGALGNQSSDEAAFIDFLRAVGVAASVVGWLWENPPITWPKIASDMFAAWWNNGKPSGPDPVVSPLVPVEWKSGTGTGSNLPAPAVPAGGYLPQVGGILPAVLPATPTQVYKAPRGYVTVRIPNGNGQYVKAFMQKRAAVALGLYKNRKRAPITGRQYDAIKKAKRWETKLAKMMGDSCNYKVTKKR